LDLILDDLDDESNKLKDIQDSINKIDQQLELLISDLKNKTSMSGDMKALQDLVDGINKEINEMCGDLNDNENSIKGIVAALTE
jgi:hypothetical protein